MLHLEKAESKDSTSSFMFYYSPQEPVRLAFRWRKKEGEGKTWYKRREQTVITAVNKQMITWH